MTTHVITATSAPSLGDVRQAGAGDWVVVRRSAVGRKDFAKYWEAVGVAFKRGAVVDVVNREAV
ncbi:hypothetical protein [Streptomyces sp. NPDC057748]|uniref:hypothetical protein n=1 Tax=Streptomyces sp. NPDC057748 TaxID=3346239 RepID=UPI0036D0C4D7